MSSRFTVYLAIAAILIGGLFLILKPKTSDAPNNQNTDPTHKIFTLQVKERKIVSGDGILKVTQGDHVVIKITADEAQEFHLHGYDRSVDLEKDKETEISFAADLTGRFVFELEESKTELGALEVNPK